VSYRRWGGRFGVSKDAVLRSMDEPLPLLPARGITAPDGRPVRPAGDLEAQLAKLTADQRAARSWTARSSRWAGPRVGRAEAVLEQPPPPPHPQLHRAHRRQGGLRSAGGGCPGATHDLTALADGSAAVPLRRLGRDRHRRKAIPGHRRSGIAARASPLGHRRSGIAAGASPLGPGRCVHAPSKARQAPPAAGRVAAVEADLNGEVSSQRVRVEHAIRHLEVHRVLHGYRLWPHRFDTVIDAVATITTMPA
jgi:hypothetical protein